MSRAKKPKKKALSVLEQAVRDSYAAKLKNGRTYAHGYLLFGLSYTEHAAKAESNNPALWIDTVNEDTLQAYAVFKYNNGAGLGNKNSSWSLSQLRKVRSWITTLHCKYSFICLRVQPLFLAFKFSVGMDPSWAMWPLLRAWWDENISKAEVYVKAECEPINQWQCRHNT